MRRPYKLIMGKLVRDKIPEIIKAAGKEPMVHTLSTEEYLSELDAKLNEEVAEYQADKSMEEMADILEVLFAICEARGHSIDELMEVKAKKQSERGAFKDNLHSIWANQELYRKGNSKEEFYNILEKNMQPVYDSARRQGYQVW